MSASISAEELDVTAALRRHGAVTAALRRHRGGGVNPPYFKSAIFKFAISALPPS
jgi:hypothetical protein